jgi:Sporulation and spore germination
VRRAAAAVGLAVALAGCGVPTGDPARTIPAAEVPPALTTPSPEPTASPVPELASAPVYLVASDEHLVAAAREVSGSGTAERLEGLLAELAAGPTAAERDEQLSTALPPDTELTVTDVSGTTATIDLGGSAQAPSGLASRRATAQLVLTATAVPGVESVVLTVDGERVDAPLPSGELTSRPLRAEDYVPLTAPAPSATPAAPS